MATIVEKTKSRKKRASKSQACATPPTLDSNGPLARSGDFWHKSAPRKLVASQESDDLAWSSWQKHLNGRTKPALPDKLADKASPLLWGVASADARESLTAWLKTLDGVTAAKSKAVGFEAIAEWLTQSDSTSSGNTLPSPNHSRECLALAYRLPTLAKNLPTELWWSVCESLFSMATDAQLQMPEEENDADTALTHQLLAGELALVLAHQFPEIEPLRSLRKSASLTLSESIAALLDGEGLPHARHLSIMRSLFACWTRCRLLGENWKKGCWSEEAEGQYEWMIRQAIRFSRLDGSMAFSQVEEREWSPALFTAALNLAGNDADYAAADALLPGRVLPKSIRADKNEVPEPENHSEWAGLAVLASDWQKTSPRITVSYGQEKPLLLEVAASRNLLLTGEWDFQLRYDGKAISCDYEWEQQCWQTDEECDFLELSLELSHGLTLERQMLLAHDDEILYLADYILSDDGKSHEFQYQAELPLAPGVHFDAETETRDGVLTSEGKPRVAVLPLALPEWRTDPRIGELSVANDRLTVTHKVKGQNFGCPLLFDLKQRRTTKQRTWRQLTVAEELEAQPHDIAAGFRAQFGKEQWVFYRSLTEPANRTLLGHNLSSEFFAGRFMETGEAEEILEIDTGED